MPLLVGASPRVVGRPTFGELPPPVGILQFRKAGAMSASRIEFLQDTFNANTLDLSKWAFTNVAESGGSTSGNFSQTGDGFLKLFATDTVAFNDDSQVDALGIYDLRGSSVYVWMNATTIVSGEAEYGLHIRCADGRDPNNNAIFFMVDQVDTSSQTFFRTVVNNGSFVFADSTSSPTTWTNATAAWLRVRESGGTVFWDRAPSTASNPPIETDWINITSTVWSSSWFPLDRLFFRFHRANLSTNLNSVADGVASFDCINTVTGAPGVSVSVAETSAVTETPSAITARVGALAETATVTETEASSVVFSSALAETAAPSDTRSAGSSFTAALTEAATPTETESVGVVKAGAITETAIVIDSFAAGSLFVGQVLESNILSDLFAGSFPWEPISSDNAVTWAAIDDTQSTDWGSVSSDDNDPGWTNLI